MLLAYENVLNDDELTSIMGNILPEDFEDGRKTAGWHARLVKNNTQVTVNNERTMAVRTTIQGAIERHSEFRRAFRPKALRPVLMSRYEPGMSYGSHIDDPIMGSKGQIRTDVALTLFLSPPDSYQGGELVIESNAVQQRVKLPVGAMVVYSANTLHRVEPVTEGVRLAAVSWAQSVIRDPEKRQMIFDLDNARRALFDREGKTHEFDLISKTHANLIRMWSEL